MFTGIVQSTGRIESMESVGGDLRLVIHCPDLGLADVREGDSISVSGICLTAVNVSASGFSADASRETLSLTTLAEARPGFLVNLEKALTLSSPLGGHLVTGHVDGKGQLLTRTEEARSVRFSIAAERDVARYIARKGSICVDGVSLTVNSVDGLLFDVNIVPHTLQATTAGEWRGGQQVNLEVDLIARYTERLIEAGTAGGSESGKLSVEFFEECGFVKHC
ncbi:MAG: riboflavin synthase [Gammaproteobacteria bacterium]